MSSSSAEPHALFSEKTKGGGDFVLVLCYKSWCSSELWGLDLQLTCKKHSQPSPWPGYASSLHRTLAEHYCALCALSVVTEESLLQQRELLL